MKDNSSLLLRDKDSGHTHTTANTHASNKHFPACLLGNVHTCRNLTGTSWTKKKVNTLSVELHILLKIRTAS